MWAVLRWLVLYNDKYPFNSSATLTDCVQCFHLVDQPVDRKLQPTDRKKPLSAVIKEVCDKWNLSGPENFALQYADGVQTYITESNRLDIKNGSILRLTKAPVSNFL
ncbi:hypothetical protein MHYP_G00116690 [Metynnis hypsauchen]